MAKNENIVKDAGDEHKYKICQSCGCKQYVNNYARHIRTKKHQQVDYINNTRFEIVKVKPKIDTDKEFIFKK